MYFYVRSLCSAYVFSLSAENKALFWFSRHISLWGSISFYLACLLNIAVAVFYPFGDDGDEGEKGIFSLAVWYILYKACWRPSGGSEVDPCWL